MRTLLIRMLPNLHLGPLVDGLLRDQYLREHPVKIICMDNVKLAYLCAGKEVIMVIPYDELAQYRLPRPKV